MNKNVTHLWLCQLHNTEENLGSLPTGFLGLKLQILNIDKRRSFEGESWSWILPLHHCLMFWAAGMKAGSPQQAPSFSSMLKMCWGVRPALRNNHPLTVGREEPAVSADLGPDTLRPRANTHGLDSVLGSATDPWS